MFERPIALLRHTSLAARITVAPFIVLALTGFLLVMADMQARSALSAIDSIHMQAAERRGQVDDLIATIYQTFGGRDVYPSLEEKAAHLLYFVIKNHSFVDGNKRIGAFLFLWFMEANGILYGAEGRKRLGDNALVALTLMIAESRASDKDTIVKVIVNLINKDNP